MACGIGLGILRFVSYYSYNTYRNNRIQFRKVDKILPLLRYPNPIRTLLGNQIPLGILHIAGHFKAPMGQLLAQIRLAHKSVKCSLVTHKPWPNLATHY